jgi:NADPH-dependent curcumin reductase CurA
VAAAAARLPAAGGVVAEALYLSVDPYQRCMFNADSGVDYAKAFAVGDPICGFGVGAVVASNVAAIPVGALVGGDAMTWRWQRFHTFHADAAGGAPDADGLPRLPLPAVLPAALGLTAATASVAIGALGITGLTAYHGVYDHLGGGGR